MSSAAHSRTSWQCRVVVALLLFVVVNVAISYLVPSPAKVMDENFIQTSDSEARQQGKWTWWVTRSYLMRRAAPDIALMGSSQMGSAVFSADAHTLNQVLDCVVHRKGSTLERALKERTGVQPDTFNFAMGGCMVSDAYMISRALFKGDHKPRMVVIGVSPRDFMDNTLPSASSTEPFSFFSPFVELGELSALAFPDVLARLDWTIKQVLPLERLHQDLDIAIKRYQQGAPTKLAATAPPKVHTKMLQAVLGSVEEVRAGEWLIPPTIPDWMFEDNSKEYFRRYKTCRTPLYTAQKAFFEAFLKDMEAQHIPVVVVGMPSLPANRGLLPAQFWGEFHSTMATMCGQHHAKWIDISENPNFVLADYLDTVHLNAHGGLKLFNQVAAAMSDDPKLVAVIQAKSGIAANHPPENAGTSASVGGGPY